MKKKLLFCGVAVVMLAAIVAFNVNSKTNNTLSSMSLDNVEALAYEINGEGYKGYCDEPWSNICVRDLIDHPGVFSPRD